MIMPFDDYSIMSTKPGPKTFDEMIENDRRLAKRMPGPEVKVSGLQRLRGLLDKVAQPAATATTAEAELVSSWQAVFLADRLTSVLRDFSLRRCHRRYHRQRSLDQALRACFRGLARAN